MEKNIILENVEYGLFSSELENEMLGRKIPYKKFLDMVASYTVIAKDDEGKEGVRVLTSDIANYGIRYDELEAAAKKNTLRNGGVVFMKLIDVMDEIEHGETNKNTSIETAVFGEGEIYVLTNKRKQLGASIIMYEDILAQIAEKAESDLYIIPASVHEVIIIRKEDGIKVEKLKEAVRGINETELEWDEVLSDNVYRYERKTKELTIE